MRRHKLNAQTVREIVESEVRYNGPIGTSEMYELLQQVFKGKELNRSIFASAFLKLDCDLAIIGGVIDLVPKGLRPLTRKETTKRLSARKERKLRARSNI